MLSDREILETIKKGTYWLKLKKLKALDFIQGKLPKLELTKNGQEELDRLIANDKSKILLVWCDQGKLRFFAFSRNVLTNEQYILLKKIYTQFIYIKNQYLGHGPHKFNDDSEIFTNIWWIKAAVSTSNEWFPKEVPVEWRYFLARFEINQPAMGHEYEVFTFSFSGEF